MNPNDQTTYTEIGFDPTTHTCALCGKREIKGCVILVKTEAGQNETVRYGSNCAKRALDGFVGAHGIMVEQLNDVAWIATYRVAGKPSGRVRVRVVARPGEPVRCQCSTFIFKGTCDHSFFVSQVRLRNENVAITA